MVIEATGMDEIVWGAEYHKKGQWSTEGAIYGIEGRKTVGRVSEGAQWNICPAHTVLSPKPQRKQSVSCGGHRIMDGLVQAESMWHDRGRRLKQEERR